MSKKIWLTQGQFALVDDTDYEWLKQWTWHDNKCTDSYYAQRTQKLPNGKRMSISIRSH